MKQLFFPWLVFTCGAFAGPALNLFRFKYPVDFSARNLESYIILLWPTWPLAIMEVSIGTFWAVAYAVSANFMFFGLVGAVAVLCAKRRPFFLIGAGVLVSFLATISFWGSGFNLKYFELRPFLTVSGLYSALLYAVYCISSRPGPSQFSENET